MRITRESEPASETSEENSAIRRAPLENPIRRAASDDDDAHELQPHEFTLEPEDPNEPVSFEEVTAPWSTLPPLPAWAATARALLEPPTVPDSRRHVTFVDDDPTPAVEALVFSAAEMRALREELAQAMRDAAERAQHVETLERSLAEANVALGEMDQRRADEHAEHEGRQRGHAFRIAELEAQVRELAEELSAAERHLREGEEAVPPATPPDRAWVFAAEGDEAFVREAEAFERVADVAVDASPPEVEALVLDDEGNEIAATDVEVTMDLEPAELSDAEESLDPSPGLAAAPATQSSIFEIAPVRARRGDDLTRIRGIGRRYAERLGELGVHTFARIAAWKPADVARIAERLGVSEKRIQREAWVKQARKLHARAGSARSPRVQPARARRTRKRA